MIVDQQLIYREKNYDSYVVKKINSLTKYYPKNKFSKKEFTFQLTENDWDVIKKDILKIQIAVTNRCNTFCKICYANSTPNSFGLEPTRRQIFKVIRNIGRGKRIILIGGEPTVRNDLVKIVKMVKKSGNIPEIYTNGLKLADFGYIKRLKKAGLKRVYLSFDGFDRNYYKVMNGNEEILTLKLLAIKNLVEVGMPTVLSSRIVNGLNEDQVKNIIDFCVQLVKEKQSIEGVLFYGATGYGRFMIKNGKMSISSLLSILEKVTDGAVNLDYLVESKKFILLLGNKLKRIGINIPYGSSGLIGFFKPGSIKRYISMEMLKKINEKLENQTLIEVFSSSVEFRNLIKNFIKDTKIMRLLRKTAMMPLESFFIGVGLVNSPINHNSKIMHDSIELFGFERTWPPIARDYSYGVPVGSDEVKHLKT